MPVVYNTDNSSFLSKGAAKLLRRDDSDDGGLKTSTKVGIAIGLTCFVTLLVSFWLIWRYRTKPRELTEDDIFAQETYHRWEENILSGGGRASGESNDRPGRHASGQTRRASASTLETYTDTSTPIKAVLDLPQPQQAHLVTHL